jgi:7,8-dihydropterin-6-yl-methyl-4-(beta-D-ribofuranosyl)aminobenzene 5'-phosphate synthase
VKITIVYDNKVWKEGLEADWGFSCLVEVEKTRKILFDTGANGRILLSNMKKLGINPFSISDVFISHSHHDHIGGLSDFLKVNSQVKLYFPATTALPREMNNVTRITKATKIYHNIFSTGILKGVEQSLVVKAEKGLVVVVGCSHPGVRSILNAAARWGKPYALIGGLHGFNQFSLISEIEIICPVHCTQYRSQIEKNHPGKYIKGGAGRTIEL